MRSAMVALLVVASSFAPVAFAQDGGGHGPPDVIIVLPVPVPAPTTSTPTASPSVTPPQRDFVSTGK